MMSGGHKVDVIKWGWVNIQLMYFITECSVTRQDPDVHKITITPLDLKELITLIAHVLVVRHCPLYVNLVSTSCNKCSQAFPVFAALPPPCIILNANRRTKTRENEAISFLSG